MSDKQPTAVTRYTVTLETGHYEIDPFLGCPSIVVLATDYDTLARFTERLLYEAEEDAVGVSEPGWPAKLRDEFDAKWPGRTG